MTTAPTQTQETPTPLRAVSRGQILALSINDVVGSGAYLLPSVALLGSASLWAVPVAGVCVFLIVLCFAEAASLFDRSGGAFVYTRAAFGDFVGFEVGWMAWVTRVTVSAVLSAGIAQVVSTVWPGAAGGWGRALACALPLLLLTTINVAGVKHGAATAVVLLVGKTVPLLFLAVVGLPALDVQLVASRPAPTTSALGQGALLLLFAYSGFENTSAPAGEFKNPQRSVPFALLFMIGVVTLIYFVVHAVAVGLVPDLTHSKTPLADAARVAVGPLGFWVLTIGAGLSILGTSNNTALSGPRYLYALAGSGRIPAFFGRIHPRFRTPWIAIITQTAIALPLALTGTFTELAALSVISRMVAYIGTAAAIPVLRRRMPTAPRTVRLPGGPVIPIAALAVCVALLSYASAKNLIAGGIALAVGAGVYLAGGRRSVLRSTQ
jgi:APA family basic amino acid/polyamine antiporter